MRKPDIKGILFDMGGVLVSRLGYAAFADGFVKSLSKKLQKKSGISFPGLEKGLKKLIDAWRTEERIGRSGKIHHFNSLVGKYYRRHTKPQKGTLALVKKLKKKYKLGVLSNTLRACALVNKNRRVFKDFDVLVLSCDVHCLKPERKIYQIASKKMKLLPKNLLFVDDKLENVKAAIKFGMKAIHFKSFRQLKRDLKKLNIA